MFNYFKGFSEERILMILGIFHSAELAPVIESYKDIHFSTKIMCIQIFNEEFYLLIGACKLLRVTYYKVNDFNRHI